MKKIAAIIMILAFVALALAGCQQIEFEVSFVSDGSVVHTIKTTGSESIKLPQDPTKEGYVFDGWYWDNGTWQRPFTASSLLNEPLKSNMSVYAKWTPEQDATQSYTVAFNTMGGNACDSQSVLFNGLVVKPSDPSKDGYIFAGWYKEADYQTKWDFTTDKITSDVTIYAKWVSSIDFSACEILSVEGAEINGKEITMQIPNAQTVVAISNIITVSPYATYVVSNDIYGNDQISSGTVTPNVGENTYYILVTSNDGSSKAQYTMKITREPNPNSVTVTVLVDGNATTYNITLGEAINAPETPSKDGYNFVCWLVDGAPVSFPYTPSTDVTLTAKWELAIDQSACEILSFEGATVNGREITMQIPFEQAAVAIPNIIKVSPNATYIVSNDIYSNDEIISGTVTPNEGENVYYILVISGDSKNRAQYTLKITRELNPVITVTVSVDGSKTTKEVARGEAMNEPEAPSKKGYYFMNWLLNGEPVSFPYTPSENVTITANWVSEDEAYLVEFSVNSEESLNGARKSVVVLKGEALSAILESLPTASKNDYRFKGWQDENGEKITLDTVVKSNIVLYPVWERIVYCLDGTEKHQWGDWEHKEPTCTEPGEKKRTCLTCAHVEYDDGGEPTGHTPSGAYSFEMKDGVPVKLFACKDCNKDIYVAFKPITNESFEAPVIDGNVFGIANAPNLIDGNFEEENTGSVSANQSPITITLEAKEPVYVDIIVVSGQGTRTHNVMVTYEDGTEVPLGVGNIGTVKYYEVYAKISKITFNMESPGYDYIYEIAACAEIGHAENNHYFKETATVDNSTGAISLTKKCVVCDAEETQSLTNITYNSFQTPVVEGSVYGAGNVLSLIDGVFPTSLAGNGVTPMGQGEVSVTLNAKNNVYVDYLLVYGKGACTYTVSVTYEDGSTQVIGYSSFGNFTTSAFEIGANVKSIELVMLSPGQGNDFVLELAACTIN